MANGPADSARYATRRPGSHLRVAITFALLLIVAGILAAFVYAYLGAPELFYPASLGQ